MEWSHQILNEPTSRKLEKNLEDHSPMSNDVTTATNLDRLVMHEHTNMIWSFENNSVDSLS